MGIATQYLGTIENEGRYGVCHSPTTQKRAPSVRKTSFEVDFTKLEAARELLGTRTLTETVDAALDEVVKRQQRRELVKLLSTPGVHALNDPDVMARAWR
ncbi:MAG TPA: type II toxin-antitoxin system VapB family antitoxin [Conexibacter sp.]|nr:type II toxin-antitoxin system VapB family antitoxin [Conexibacter sp.]